MFHFEGVSLLCRTFMGILPLPPGESPSLPFVRVHLPCRTSIDTPNCCPDGITVLPMGLAGGVCFPLSIGVPLPHGTPIPSHPPPNSHVPPRLLLLLPRKLQQLRQGLRVQGAVQQQVQLLPLSHSTLPVNSWHASGMGGGGHKNPIFFMFSIFCTSGETGGK